MTKSELMELAKKMVVSDSCCKEAKESAQAWIESIDTDKEAEMSENFIKELENDVVSLEEYFRFFENDGKKYFESSVVEKYIEDGKAAKEKGEKWCLCDACQAGAKILENKEIILKK